MKVIVVGAGLAGTLAAARAHALGAQVVVFADRPGATVMHSGGWAIGAASLLAQGLPPDRLEDALALLTEGLAELTLVRGPLLLTDTDGIPRPVDLVPASHAVSATWRNERAVVDLAGLGHPFAEMQPRGVALSVDYPTWPGAFGRSYAAVAARMAQPGELDALAAALLAGLARLESPVDGVILPPVLGLDTPEVHRAALSAAIGLPVAETLGTAPSTPGLRLHRALGRWLDRLDIPIRSGRVVAVDAAMGRVTGEDGRSESADAVVLATGGRFSGGLTGAPTSPLGSAPIRPRPAVELARGTRAHGPYWGRLFESGVRVDARMRVLGHDGSPLEGLLYAAGDLLRGPDALTTGCASGKAVLSGYLAGESAAKGGAR